MYLFPCISARLSMAFNCPLYGRYSKHLTSVRSASAQLAQSAALRTIKRKQIYCNTTINQSWLSSFDIKWTEKNSTCFFLKFRFGCILITKTNKYHMWSFSNYPIMAAIVQHQNFHSYYEGRLSSFHKEQLDGAIEICPYYSRKT